MPRIRHTTQASRQRISEAQKVKTGLRMPNTEKKLMNMFQIPKQTHI